MALASVSLLAGLNATSSNLFLIEKVGCNQGPDLQPRNSQSSHETFPSKVSIFERMLSKSQLCLLTEVGKPRFKVRNLLVSSVENLGVTLIPILLTTKK